MSRTIQFGAPEVRAAVTDGSAVVALETAVVTHGLPQPKNLEIVRLMQERVREAGAIPATVGVMSGNLVIGLDDAQLHALASDEQACKASTRDLAALMHRRANAGTTVAATLAACRAVGIRVFATGGIGGVHREWSAHPDVSADLDELAMTRTCVVSAGAKAILDLPATLEALESRGVPVIGYQTDAFPRFYAPGDATLLPVPHRVERIEDVASMCRLHWDELDLQRGILLANPVPADAALDPVMMDAAIADAQEDAVRQGIMGAALTPFLLDVVAKRTAGRSMTANLALLESNASLAGELAVALQRG